MATAKSHKSGKATEEFDLFQRLWLACQLMALTPKEYAAVYKAVCGTPPPAFRNERLGGPSCRQITVPGLVSQLTNRQATALLKKVDDIDRERHSI
jgi:hypothetical protein